MKGDVIMVKKATKVRQYIFLIAIFFGLIYSLLNQSLVSFIVSGIGAILWSQHYIFWKVFSRTKEKEITKEE